MLFLLIYLPITFIIISFIIRDKLPRLYPKIRIKFLDNIFNELDFIIFGEQTIEQALSKHTTNYNKEITQLTPKQKGDLFENYVVNLLPENYAIEHWRSDKIFNKRWAKSNSYPDLEINKYNNNDRKGTPFTFSIECKYRSQFSKEGEITLGKEYQIYNYKKYAQKKRQKVFIALGIEGTPKNPKEIYLIPLSAIKQNQNTISKNEIDPYRKEKANSKLFLNTKNYSLS